MAVMFSALASCAVAQGGYPTRSIRFIVPYPPGGSTDPIARLTATKLAERLHQSVIVDNRPGGNTVIGTELVARATPDGYTLLLISPAFTNTPSLIPRLAYDPVRDFAGVATMAKFRFALVVPVSSPANALQELVALAKTKSRQLTYASSGIGSAVHLTGALFNLQLGARMHHVPYKGAAVLQTDLIAGRVDLAFQAPINILSHVRAGRLKALAMSGEGRLSAMPEVPTFREGGMPNFVVSAWQGIAVPKATPKQPIDRISKEVTAILGGTDVQEYLVKFGAELFISSPMETSALIQSDVAMNARIIKDAGITME